MLSFECSSKCVQIELVLTSSQLHFTLRITSQWHEVHNRFDCKALYRFIVGYLKDGTTDTEILLDRWNE